MFGIKKYVLTERDKANLQALYESLQSFDTADTTDFDDFNDFCDFAGSNMKNTEKKGFDFAWKETALIYLEHLNLICRAEGRFNSIEDVSGIIFEINNFDSTFNPEDPAYSTGPDKSTLLKYSFGEFVVKGNNIKEFIDFINEKYSIPVLSQRLFVNIFDGLYSFMFVREGRYQDDKANNKNSIIYDLFE